MTQPIGVAALEPGAAPSAADDRVSTPSRSAGWRWFGQKVAGSAATLGFIVVVNFFLFRVINEHPERTLARGRAKTPEQVQAIVDKYGLDDPLPQQFLVYLKNIITLDFGDSFQYSQPVRGLMLDRLWPTVALVGTSTILSIMIGIWIGTIAAWNRGRTFDGVSTTSTITLYSMPEWWLGLILFLFFATGFGPLPRLFPIGQLKSAGIDAWSFDGVVDQTWHLVLPVVTLTLAYLAEYSLIMRSALLDEMGEDYLQTARAKGLSDLLVRRRHATRNALLPVVTLVSLNLGFIVSGAITVETVFSIPGLGLLTTDALRIPDIPVLQGTFFVFSAAVVIANLISNLLYGWLDPRVRV
ncbi:MAG: ABC transporter permease [Nocardioidaceae bacterium]